MNENGSILSRLFQLLPTLMIALLLSANAMFCATTIFPAWRAYESLENEAQSYRSAAETLAAQPTEDTLSILQSQVNSANEDLVEAAAAFLTDNEVDTLINNLYQYADEQQVVISTFQAQQPAQVAPTQGEAPYTFRIFRLKVDGTVPALMKFVIALREASLNSVQINNLNLNSTSLTMDIQITTSTYASGGALAALTTITPAPTVLTASPETSATALPGEQSVVLAPVATSTPEATLVPLMDCPGAAAPRFQVGDIAVVDFNVVGALRVMYRVDGTPLDTPRQVYDNDVLRLLAGPVCGKWNDTPIWYWYIKIGQTQGWVGEGTSVDFWLCPLNSPECAQN